jgi:hypothetical protein
VLLNHGNVHENGRGEVHSPISGDVSHNLFLFIKKFNLDNYSFWHSEAERLRRTRCFRQFWIVGKVRFRRTRLEEAVLFCFWL